MEEKGREDAEGTEKSFTAETRGGAQRILEDEPSGSSGFFEG